MVRETGLSYDDVLLVPRRGILDNRKDADLTSTFVAGVELDIPIVSAPMSSVTEENMAEAMDRAGGIGVLHRFSENDHRIDMIDELTSRDVKNVAVAIGLQDSMMCLDDLTVAGANVLVLDVAHGHCDRVFQYIDQVNDFFDRDQVKLVVGNVASFIAAIELTRAGVDGIKVGIGPGAACTTREVTGFGVPQLTAVMEVRRGIEYAFKNEGIPAPTLIADGGIKNSGDIVKALAAGADTVMLGRLLAGADEAPFSGEYFGMASRRVNGHNAPEGVEGTVERTGPVSKTLKSLTWGIRSGVSYAGVRSVRELREMADFIQVAEGTMLESSTRL